MCGITGVVSAQLDPSRREAAVAAMVAAQRQRGPDDAGWVSSGDATLGMARLAIIDPAKGRQPMRAGRHVLVFNGAIYNYRELKAELARSGWEFRADGHTEVLLAAYATWGRDCLPRLRGAPLVGPLRARRDRAWLDSAACVVVGEDMAGTVAARGVPRERVHYVPNWAPRELHAPPPRRASRRGARTGTSPASSSWPTPATSAASTSSTRCSRPRSG